MKKIDGTPKTIRELFTGVKYTIHYYQREYQWQTKQIEELIDDLTEEFFEFYSDQDERGKVLEYGHVSTPKMQTVQMLRISLISKGVKKITLYRG